MEYLKGNLQKYLQNCKSRQKLEKRDKKLTFG